MDEKPQRQDNQDSELELLHLTPATGIGQFTVDREAPGCNKTKQLELTIA